MLALAAVVVVLFLPNVEGEATFGLSMPYETIQLDPLVVPVQPALWFLALVLGFLGGSQFVRGFQRKATLLLGRPSGCSWWR